MKVFYGAYGKQRIKTKVETVEPTGPALSYLRPGIYEMAMSNGWAYFYRDGRQLWDCNGRFAKRYFRIVKQLKEL